MESNRLLILTEAGDKIGMGHYSRCSAIRDYCLERGLDCDLVVDVQEETNSGKVYDGKRADWQRELDTLNINKQYSKVLLDSYLLPVDRVSNIRPRFRGIVALDDFHRFDKGFDLIINPNVYGDRVAYKSQSLGGRKFVILRKAFRDETKRAVIRTEMQRILIVLGGSDVRNLLAPIVSNVLNFDAKLQLSVVCGDAEKASKLKSRFPEIYTYGFLAAEEMRDLMLESDLCISACGQTLHELAYLGLPTVGICVGDDQKLNMDAYCEAGFLNRQMFWDQPDLMAALSSEVGRMRVMAKREKSSVAGRRIIDNKGLENICDAIFAKEISFRRASQHDAETYFRWVNDAEVRKQSHSQAQVSWEDHKEWFSRKLASADTIMLVFTSSEDLLGQVRIDFKNGKGEIDFSVDPAHRGKGIGSQMLWFASREALASGKCKLIEGVVKEDNAASAKAFLNAGFTLTGQTSINGIGCNIFHFHN
jgi:UDP-2,4-diacetamido-2,4,6-trideoxy-beta-L-altropyranose hydrolase